MVSRRLRFARLHARQKVTNKTLFTLTSAVIAGLILIFIIFAWIAKDLPAPGKLSQTSQSSTVFYDRDGKVLFELYKDRNRVPVTLPDTKDYMKQATIAIEDKNFYRHQGFSQTGILRAFFSTIFGGTVQGGSTITQQLIKNVLLDSKRSITRKLKEVILAVIVEKRYTKDQILELYLNEAPYGGSFWGIGSASQGYFAKSPKDLNLLESAFLAGLPQRPTYYSPFIGEKDAWKGRTKDVLRRMREDGYITRKQEDDAVAQIDKLKFSQSREGLNAPHYVFYVRDQIEKEFGPTVLEQGLRVKTTLSSDAQKGTEKIVREEVEKLKGAKVGNGAAVVLDSKTGQVLAMVGSYNYSDAKYGNFNAALGLRQPGSSIKPITYAAAFEKGYTPSTLLMDLSTVFPSQGGKDYVPVNYDGKFRGPMQLRFALGNSINVVAVKLLAMVGIRNFLQKADDMGIKTLAPTQKNMDRFGLGVTLGGGEVTLLDLTSAYSVFAREGLQKNPQTIMEIKDYKGKTILKQKESDEHRALSKETAFLISHILSDNNARVLAFGPNSYLRIPGKTVAVKTGTTDDKRDNWTIGYTNDVTVGVWVGNNDNSPMDPRIASGVTGASPIWNRIMSDLLKKNYKDGIATKPDGVVALTIDSYLGGLPKDGQPTRSEYFKKGTEPKDVSSAYKKLKISKSTGKLANDVEIRAGNYEEKDFIVITENDPVSTDGKNRWQEAIDAWRNTQDDKYKYPSETSDASQDDMVVNIKEPSDKSKVDSNDVKIVARLTSNSNVKNVKIIVDGQEKKSLDGDRDEVNETLTLSDGKHEIKVEATNEKDKKGDSTVKIGVKTDAD